MLTTRSSPVDIRIFSRNFCKHMLALLKLYHNSTDSGRASKEMLRLKLYLQWFLQILQNFTAERINFSAVEV